MFQTERKKFLKGKRTMGKFETAILPQLEKIRAKIESGISCAALARELGISLSTLNRCRKQHPEFGELFSDAESARDDLVEEALLRRATGYESSDGKEIPPDVRAAVFWLKNRRPENWQDRREIALSEPVKIELKPEEKDL